MPDLENSAQKAFEEGQTDEDRRLGAKDRRNTDKDRRDSERIADEIAPRRHPDIKGRRSTDK